MPRAVLHRGLLDQVERVDHLEVRERVEAGERLGAEAVVEADDRLDVAPVVVDRLAAPALDAADLIERQEAGVGCAHCASARSPVPFSASGVGTCGLSRRYHSASSAD